MIRARLMIFVLASVVWGQAQSVHTIGSTTPDCLRKASQVQQMVLKYAPLVRWDYAVACENASWERVCGRYNNCSMTSYAFTLLDQSWTFINAEHFGDEQFTSNYVIEHELGHILTHSTSCKKADKWVKEQS